MKHKSFEHMDERWMKILESERERKINPEILKGFSASVERRLAVDPAPARRKFFPVAAPVLTMLVLAAVVVTRSNVVSVSGSASELPEEIAALSEMGVWTDEDDQAVLPASEINFDLESLA